MAINKKQRFHIFNRDGFTCQYCGEKPPNVILHIDHMVSKKDGGGDEEENLITSCSSCNLGKSSKSVDWGKIKNSSYKKEMKTLEEKREQLEAYYQFLKKKKEAESEEINIFQRHWNYCSNNEYSLSSSGLQSMKKVKEKYSTENILSAIEISWANDSIDAQSKFKYMCGILKNMKLEEENPEEAKRKHECHKIILYIQSNFGYVNERMMWCFLNTIPLDVIHEAINDSGNWGQLRDSLKEYSSNPNYE